MPKSMQTRYKSKTGDTVIDSTWEGLETCKAVHIVQSHSWLLCADNLISQALPSLVPSPFPAPVLIAYSIKTEGKAWEKESRA